jgi:hypothetical protein
MAYTEVLFTFLVRRCFDEGDRPDEILTYVGAVYIDDSLFLGAEKDPAAFPIVLGREAYGMPKNPGQICYSPLPRDLQDPVLQVWDHTNPDRLTLTDAIRVRKSGKPRSPVCSQPSPVPPSPPTLLAALWSRVRSRLVRKPTPVPPRPIELPGDRAAAPPEARYRVLAALLKMEVGVLLEHVGDPPGGFPRAARLLHLPGRSAALIWDDLLWQTQLVGLKQFPDPTSTSPNVEACYQAIVETPLAEDAKFPLPGWYTINDDLELEFPPVDRLTLKSFEKQFGITNTKVSRTKVHYSYGRLVFADPSRVTVWTPT